MPLIELPKNITITDKKKNNYEVVIEPCFPGYGVTLGNTLRRVLLSSLSGAAVTHIKIKGIQHEFETIEYVKEDVVEIMLNLKGIRFRVFGDEPQTLRLTKKGSGSVTSKDIQTNADVEIVNPDHVICHLDGAKAELTMDLTVETGRGYRTLDESGARKSNDMIAIDAIFSPVSRVRYKVENTRVGQMTDLDKLVITVDTDGSITPSDAFEEAAAILVNQYTALAGQTRVETGAPLGSTPTESDLGTDGEDTAELMTPIEDLNLSARTTNALINNDIHTLKDLFSLSDAELRDLKGFGSKALDEVKEKMAELEL